MTKRVINHVQEFLTVVDDGKVYQIVNIVLLLKRHPTDAVISFLKELQSDYKKELVVTDCGLDWFEFEGRWKMHKGINDTFILISPTLKMMAKDCYIELS